MMMSKKLSIGIWTVIFYLFIHLKISLNGLHLANAFKLSRIKYLQHSRSALYDQSIPINPDTLKKRLTSDTSRAIDPKVVAAQIDFDNIENNFHKREDDWGCMKNCGACCKLGPEDSRPQAKYDLSPQDYDLYLSMIGKDDWCIYFDKKLRQCTVFDTRPSFCRVEKKKYIDMYELQEDEYTDFLRYCCTESIEDAYGKVSIEEYKYSRLMDMVSPEPLGYDPIDLYTDDDEEEEEEWSEVEIIDPRMRPPKEEGEVFQGLQDDDTVMKELFPSEP